MSHEDDLNAGEALERLFATDRIILRAIQGSDAPRIAELLADGRVAQTLARVPSPYTEKDARAFCAHAAVDGCSGREHYFAIERRGGEDGLIGVISLERETGEGPPVLGYWLGEAYWGAGLMSEAVSTLLDIARVSFRITTIRSGYFVGNVASARIQKKVGFQEVGTSLVYSTALDRETTHIDTTLDLRGAA